jgi:hypothetical protein
MTDFETVLDDCLKRLASGEPVNACLALYPQFAEDLRPLLSAALHVGRIAEVQPSDEFKSRTRKQLDSHMREHPRRGSSGSSFFRIAAVAILLLVCLFLAGAAYAQSASPGDGLYRWKLASEDLVRVVSPIRVDLWLVQRRADEVMAVRTDPARLAIAWAQYRLVEDRLLAYHDSRYGDEIQLLLKRQADAFAKAGVLLPTGTSALPVLPTLTPTPQPTDPITGLAPTPTPTSVLSTITPTDVLYPTATDFTLATLPPFQTNTPRPTWTSRPTDTPRPTRTPTPTDTPKPTRCIGPQCP